MDQLTMSSFLVDTINTCLIDKNYGYSLDTDKLRNISHVHYILLI